MNNDASLVVNEPIYESIYYSFRRIKSVNELIRHLLHETAVREALGHAVDGSLKINQNCFLIRN